jgi:peptidoglycan/LPS O-acetylase OafA/YrhL
VAILLTLIHHFTPGTNTGYYLIDTVYSALALAAWCGVDLFFVLSGFLITGILVDAKGSAHYFRNFYIRRTLRIFPLYYGVLFAVFAVVPRIAPPDASNFRDMADRQAWLWFYGANILLARDGKWLDASKWFDFNAFWSLSVEEHFYLVWPSIVLAFSRTTLMGICVGLFATALALRLWLVTAGIEPIAAFVLTPCRMDSLAVGGFLALAVRGTGGLSRVGSLAPSVAASCGTLLLGLFVWRGKFEVFDPLVQTAGYSILACFFGAILILAVQSSSCTWIGSVCNHASWRFFGKYSYGLYIFHTLLEPSLQGLFPRRTLSDLLGSRAAGGIIYMCLASSASVMIAWISWHAYEKQFLKLKKRFA